MPSDKNSLPRLPSLIGMLLCGMALLMLCSCARESRTPPVQSLSTTISPSAPSVSISSSPPASAAVKSLLTPSTPATMEPSGILMHVSKRDLPNFHAVTPVLLRGAAPTPQGLEMLQKMGVKTVIDLRIAPKTVAKEHAQLDRMGVHFINLPMSGEPPTEAQIKTFLSTIADPAQQPVFVHCQHGADRTGTMIGIYREHITGWPYDRTYQEMRKYGFNPHWKKLSATVRRFAPSDPTHAP